MQDATSTTQSNVAPTPTAPVTGATATDSAKLSFPAPQAPPKEGEDLVLVVDVIKGEDLAGKGKNGLADPYVVVSCGSETHTTATIPQNLSPEWNEQVTVSLSHSTLKSGKGLLLTIWSRNRFMKTFLGEVFVVWNSLFQQDSVVAYDDPQNEAIWFDLSNREKTKAPIIPIKPLKSSNNANGRILLKYGLRSSASDNAQLAKSWSDLLTGPSASTEAVPTAATAAMGNMHIQGHSESVVNAASDKQSSVAASSGKSAKATKSAEKEDKAFAKFEDIIGMIYIEVTSASDLPREKNLTRTSYDMDPYVVVSFGRNTFRTRVIRHNLNPVWTEKLAFKVRKSEEQWDVNFGIYDWENLSGNEAIGYVKLPIQELIQTSTKESRDTSHQELSSLNEKDLDKRVFDIQFAKPEKWDGKFHSKLTIRAKFVTYAHILRQFWLALTKIYDTDDNGKMSRLEVQMMLESLNSTLSEKTVNSFWTSNKKSPETDELTFEELVVCLENEIVRNGRARTPHVEVNSKGSQLAPPQAKPHDQSLRQDINDAYDWEDDNMSDISEDSDIPSGSDLYNDGTITPQRDEDSQIEKVIRVRECPICHTTNMSKHQMDIVTHIATCASNDWTTIDHFVMGNFVTSAEANRKWIVKLVSKVGYGRYGLGTNNANIIVQDRATGQLVEEKMSVYVRLGMRLLYRGMGKEVESKRALALLKSLSIKQGKKYDDPASVREIQPFINFHKLDMSEVLDPVDSFKCFNEFFYRKLKPEARPCADPDNPRVLVSPADCRMMAFPTIDEATRLWIKGLDFTVEKLLGSKELAQTYNGGSLAIFRLAPQDYHRFHIPVDGVMSESNYITGQYFTVNPMAVRSKLDVYGENVREILTIDSPVFGKVACACVGAMMVGSICITAKAGSQVKRAEELGYFKFGGSTIVIVFPAGAVEFDPDLLENAGNGLETLVRAGTRIGLNPGK